MRSRVHPSKAENLRPHRVFRPEVTGGCRRYFARRRAPARIGSGAIGAQATWSRSADAGDEIGLRRAAAGIGGKHRNSIDIGVAEEPHAEALVKCDGPQICRRGYRLVEPATMQPSQLHEVAEKLAREALPTGRRPHSDRVHISHRFGLREKAKQISDDLGSVANDECRVSKLVNEEWMVQVAGITRAPEFLQLIENLVVVLLGAHRNFCGTAHRRSAGIVTTRIQRAARWHQVIRELSIWQHAVRPTVAV